MTQRFTDDNGILTFIDDNSVVLFIDDNGIYLGDPPAVPETFSVVHDYGRRHTRMVGYLILVGFLLI